MKQMKHIVMIGHVIIYILDVMELGIAQMVLMNLTANRQIVLRTLMNVFHPKQEKSFVYHFI
jgi:hypothetical protein